MKKLATLYGIPRKRISHYYKHITSDFAKHPELYKGVGETGMIFTKHIGERLCLDEKDICGKVYTILSNPVKDKIVAILPGTKSRFVIDRIREEIAEDELRKVKQICTDMSPTMECICRELFLGAELVTDRFHVMKNLLEDMGSLRIRIKAQLKNENMRKRKESKEKGIPYNAVRLRNGETLYEAISRVSWQFKKRKTDRTGKQRQRRTVMQHEDQFEELIELYKYLMRLRRRYDSVEMGKKQALVGLEKLIEEGESIGKKIMEAETMAKMLSNRKETICNYFLQRHSNGYAEGLNSRIGRLISMCKGFRDTDYMMYRITRIFA